MIVVSIVFLDSFYQIDCVYVMKQAFNKVDIILAAVSLAINIVMLSLCILKYIEKNNPSWNIGIWIFGFLTLLFSTGIIIMKKNLKKD